MNKTHFLIRLPNWLGDVIMTLPSLDALSTAGYSFHLLGKPWLKDLLSAYSYRCHTIPSNMWDIRCLYRSLQIKQAILFTNGLSSTVPLLGTDVATAGYYRSKLGRLLLTKAKTKPSGLHEIEYFWQLTQFAVNKPLIVPTNPKLLISDRYQARAKQILSRNQIFSGFFVICPGAIGKGANKESKIWPYWRELCAKLHQKGIQIIACPAPYETTLFETILGKDIHCLSNLNLPLYAAIMMQAAQVIANDSGPMHMAAAVQAPVLGIFGQSDPLRTQPWGGDFIGRLGHWPSCEEVFERIFQSRR